MSVLVRERVMTGLLVVVIRTVGVRLYLQVRTSTTNLSCCRLYQVGPWGAGLCNDTAGRGSVVGHDPDWSVLWDFSKGPGTMTRVKVGFLFLFQFLIGHAEILEVIPLRSECVRGLNGSAVP